MRFVITVFVVLFLSVAVFGCRKKSTATIQHYGSINEVNKNKVVLIAPKEFLTFNQLVDRIEEVVCKDSIPVIRLKNKSVERQIGLANFCREGTVSYDIKRRNVLKIQDEKIKINNLLPLDSLPEYLSRHYHNYGQSAFFSENPNRAIVSVTYKDLPATNIENLINRIVNFYDQQKLPLPLILTLDRFKPPVPPIDNDKNFSNELVY